MRRSSTCHVTGLVLGLAAALATGCAPPAAAATPPGPRDDRPAAVAEVARTSPSGAALSAASPVERLRLLVRCVPVDGGSYCLHLGHVDDDVDSPAFWRRLADTVADRSGSRTGDVALADRLDRVAAMAPAARRRTEVRELRDALARPAAAAVPPSRSALRVTARSRGRVVTVMRRGHARRQVRDIYCGPATLQMIDGADDGRFDRQRLWARRLRTHAQHGTWIGDIVAQLNARTRWGRRHPFRVVTLPSDETARRFFARVRHQISGERAPFVQHPDLAARYHPYLSTPGDYGGHFQVARGYQVTRGQRYLLVLEPYNEPDWTGWSRRTWGPQRIKLGRALRANQANQSTIGI
jgi:hypothetical protein